MRREAMTALLQAWLANTTSARALVLEEGLSGETSPLRQWIGGVTANAGRDIVFLSLAPSDGLVLERPILEQLYREIEADPEERAATSTWTVSSLRDHARAALRRSTPQRLVVLERVSWAERSFQDSLAFLLAPIGNQEKMVVSVRVDGGHDVAEASFGEWCARLGWRPEETRCLRLPALLKHESQLPPNERVAQLSRECTSSSALV